LHIRRSEKGGHVDDWQGGDRRHGITRCYAAGQSKANAPDAGSVPRRLRFLLGCSQAPTKGATTGRKAMHPVFMRPCSALFLLALTSAVAVPAARAEDVLTL